MKLSKEQVEMKPKQRLVREFLGDFSMAGARRSDAPGNIRYGQNVRGSRTSHLAVEPTADETLPKVALAYVKSGGKVLAVSRGADMSDMNMPGGGVELGEDPRDAAARELWEETGIVAHEMFPVFSKTANGKIITAYKVVSYGGELRGSDEGTPEWVEPSVLRASSYGKFFDEMLDSLAGDALTESVKT